jgi:hypothetical protein
MVLADCDLRVTLHTKRWFDAVGHYSREDALVSSTLSDADRNRVRPSVAERTEADPG